MNNLPDRLKNGKLPAYAWPGVYPLYYYGKHSGVICPQCATEFSSDRNTEDRLIPIACDINWEDPDLYCKYCNARIHSAR